MATASRDRRSEFGFWPSGDEERELASLLALPWSGQMQDWELEVADPGRVEEFFGAYERLTLSPSQRFSLVELIVASLDRLESVSSALESKLHALLASDPVLHAYTMNSWSADDVVNVGEAFAVTGLMRRIRKRVRAEGETQNGT